MPDNHLVCGTLYTSCWMTWDLAQLRWVIHAIHLAALVSVASSVFTQSKCILYACIHITLVHHTLYRYVRSLETSLVDYHFLSHYLCNLTLNSAIELFNPNVRHMVYWFIFVYISWHFIFGTSSGCIILHFWLRIEIVAWARKRSFGYF